MEREEKQTFHGHVSCRSNPTSGCYTARHPVFEHRCHRSLQMRRVSSQSWAAEACNRNCSVPACIKRLFPFTASLFFYRPQVTQLVQSDKGIHPEGITLMTCRIGVRSATTVVVRKIDPSVPWAKGQRRKQCRKIRQGFVTWERLYDSPFSANSGCSVCRIVCCKQQRCLTDKINQAHLLTSRRKHT